MTKTEKNDNFISIFRPLPKLEMFLKTYSESPFHSDFKNSKCCFVRNILKALFMAIPQNGITIEFSCKNEAENLELR